MPISSLIVSRRGGSVSVIIAESQANFSLLEAIGSPTWPVNFVVTIPEGVTIRGGDIGSGNEYKPAFTTEGLHPSSRGQIILDGKIVGRGGRGGLGGILMFNRVPGGNGDASAHLIVAAKGGGGAGLPVVSAKRYPLMWSQYYQRAYTEIMGWSEAEIRGLKIKEVKFDTSFPDNNSQIIIDQSDVSNMSSEFAGGPAGIIPYGKTDSNIAANLRFKFYTDDDFLGSESPDIINHPTPDNVNANNRATYCNPWTDQEGEDGQTALRVTCQVTVIFGPGGIVAGGGGGGAGGTALFFKALEENPLRYKALTTQPAFSNHHSYAKAGGAGGARGSAGALGFLGTEEAPNYFAFGVWDPDGEPEAELPLGYGYYTPGMIPFDASVFGAAVESSHHGYVNWAGVPKITAGAGQNVFGIWPHVNSGEKPGISGQNREFLKVRGDTGLNGLYDPQIFIVEEDLTNPNDAGLYLAISSVSGVRPYEGEYLSGILAKSGIGPYEDGKVWKHIATVFRHTGAADSITFDMSNNPLGSTVDFDGSWHYEVNNAAYNPDAAASDRWNYVTFQVAWNYATGNKIPNYSWIARKVKSRSFQLEAATAERFICHSMLPDPYGPGTEAFTHVLDVDFPDTVTDLTLSHFTYSEPAIVYFNGKMYLAIDAIGLSGTAGTLLFSSTNNFATMTYLGVVAQQADANDLGFSQLTAPSFIIRDGVVYLVYTYKLIGDPHHIGAKIFTFSDIDTATLIRDGGTAFLLPLDLDPEILTISPPNAVQYDAGTHGGGHAGYDPRATDGGVLIGQITLNSWPTFASTIRTKVNPWE